tara:strand:+ start:1616 stop:2536 length:921 start_codon:yes stop_codon:yes gene_type:complete
MKVKLLYTTGNKDIIEEIWDKPEPANNEIEVQSIITGICSSDVAMYNGTFTTLPKVIQGHECVGRVTKLGADAGKDIKVGDYVATRGEPGFADYYNTPVGNFVRVPTPDPKYILEPVACGINIAKCIMEGDLNKSIAIIGTGFLARVIYEYLSYNGYKDFTVYGSGFKDYWSSAKGVEYYPNKAHHLDTHKRRTGFDYFIDLTSKPHYMQSGYVNTNGTYVVGAEKVVEHLDFSKFLWENITIKCPSPRTDDFIESMSDAAMLVKAHKIKVDDMWGECYHRDNAKEAFENRTNGKELLRNYITWAK